MAARARRSAIGRVDYWPGFVDAMSTLLLVFVFLSSLFMVAQFFMSREITGRDTVLSRLNAQIQELTELLALERAGAQETEQTLVTLEANLASAEGERDRLQGLLDTTAGEAGAAGARVATLEGDLDDEKKISQQ